MVICVLFCFGASQTRGDLTDFDREGLMIKDSVMLKSGSTLYGTIKSEGVGDDGRKFVIFESEDGTTMKLDLTRMVYRGKFRKIDESDVEYNQWIMTLKDEPNAHWEVVKWLEAQPSGGVRYKNQIQFHLERIMELDPNDEKAKRELGYDYIRSQNRWVPAEQFYESLGYVKSGTSWAPKLQARVSAQNDTNGAIEGERKLAFRRC